MVLESKILEHVFLFLVFPGFLFSALAGALVGWVDRKVTARIQWRVGPPWYQNIVDAVKLLFYKETLIPDGVSATLFFGMPLVALACASLVSTIILVISSSPASTFIGDIIVIVYLLIIPSIAIMTGAFACGNPFASLGASREMKLVLSYELPFILSLIVVVMKCGYTVKLGEIIIAQQASGPIIASVSGVLSFIVMLMCVQAKLGFVPFDMAEAETEIIGGTCIEYSGKALGILKLAKYVMGFCLPVLMVALYFGGIRFEPLNFLKNVLQFTLILVLMIVIKNTNPRVRIDQAMRFFWGPMTLTAVLAVVLAHMGY